MTWGLKRVSTRRRDAVASVAWDRMEALLARYYRRKGYEVEHCGTGGRRSRFDGGVDLRLRRGAEVILVQCKHWNAYKVPHNEVHQLIGIMVNEQATGAILASSGEFTKAAIEAAARNGRVQLIDGDELRQMIGADVEGADASGPASGGGGGWTPASAGFASYAAERLVSAAEDRIRGKGRGRGSSIVAASAWTGLVLFFIKLGILVVFMLLAWGLLKYAISNIAPVVPPSSPTATTQARSSQPAPPAATAQVPVNSAQMYVAQPKTPEEIEAWRRRNEESMRILRETTPELPVDPRTRDIWADQ